MAVSRFNPDYPDAGMVQIVPTSVAVGSGSGSVDGNGAVTFSGASSVSINGCFSATYDNYLVLLNITNFSATGDFWMRLRSSGTDVTSSIYNRMAVSVETNVAPGGYNGPGATVGYLGGAHNSANIGASTTLTVFRPYLSVEKFTTFITSTRGPAGAYTSYSGGLQIGTSSLCDGITFSNSSGNITGTVRFYGYRN